MPKEIILPEGTEFIPVADVPELISHALHSDASERSQIDADFFRYMVEGEHRKAIISAIRCGQLHVLNPLTRLPADEFLPDAIVSVVSLIEYIKPLNIAVRFEKIRQVASTNQAPVQDWREEARKIADELFDHDSRLNTRDQLGKKNKRGEIVGGYAYRVMDIMQERNIHGARGRIDNAATIMREALQGKKWWANKSK